MFLEKYQGLWQEWWRASPLDKLVLNSNALSKLASGVCMGNYNISLDFI